MVRKGAVALKPAPGGADGAVVKARYGRVLLAWIVAVAAPPVLATLALMRAMDARCGPDSVDCSWGLEVLLVLPVAGVCLLSVGPLAVYGALRLAHDQRAGRTAAWALGLVVPTLGVAYLVGAFSLLLAPPLGGRWLALRGARPPRPEPGGAPAPPPVSSAEGS